MVVTLIGLALIPRWLTFDRYLPYLDYADENNMYLMARDWRGLEDNSAITNWLQGYPPLYIWLNMGVQPIVEAFRTRPWVLAPDYLYGLRLTAVIASLVTTLLVAGLGWVLGGRLAGWWAGAIWALSPLVVESSNLAIPDPFVFLACALSLLAACLAWRDTSPRWLLLSLVAGLAAVYLKYPAVYALIPSIWVGLALFRRQPRRMLPWLALYLLLGLAAAFYLVAGYGALTLSNREAESARDISLGEIINGLFNSNNWAFSLLPIGTALSLVTFGLGLIAYGISRRRGWRTLELRYLGLIAIYCAVAIVIVSQFSEVSLEAGKIRHTLPLTVGLVAVWGAALAQIVWTVQAWASIHQPRLTVYAPLLLSLVVAGFALPPLLTGNLELVRQFQKTASQSILWKWADENIPLDGIILVPPDSRLAHTWNRPWSGYDGVKSFVWWFEGAEQIVVSAPSQYVERDIDYFTLDEDDRLKHFATPEGQAFLDSLTLLKTFPASPQMEGDTVYFYRMQPPAFSAVARYGDQIQLVGYDLSSNTLQPGDSLIFRPYWRSLRRPATNYSLFIHLTAAADPQPIAQADGNPAQAGRLTLNWDDPTELLIGADWTLTLPPETPPGAYQLRIGLYDFTSGARLTLADGSDALALPITVR